MVIQDSLLCIDETGDVFAQLKIINGGGSCCGGLTQVEGVVRGRVFLRFGFLPHYPTPI